MFVTYRLNHLMNVTKKNGKRVKALKVLEGEVQGSYDGEIIREGAVCQFKLRLPDDNFLSVVMTERDAMRFAARLILRFA
jgi:hypothetical protein